MRGIPLQRSTFPRGSRWVQITAFGRVCSRKLLLRYEEFSTTDYIYVRGFAYFIGVFLGRSSVDPDLNVPVWNTDGDHD